MPNLKASLRDGVVVIQHSDNSRIAKLWKNSITDAVYVKSTGRNVRHRNPKTFNCITYTFYDLSIPKVDRLEPLEVSIRFETGESVPKSVSINHLYESPGSYKTGRSIEDLMLVISRIDILYSDSRAGVTYKYPFSKIETLWQDLRKQLENAFSLLPQEA